MNTEQLYWNSGQNQEWTGEWRGKIWNAEAWSTWITLCLSLRDRQEKREAHTSKAGPAGKVDITGRYVQKLSWRIRTLESGIRNTGKSRITGRSLFPSSRPNVDWCWAYIVRWWRWDWWQVHCRWLVLRWLGSLGGREICD